MTKKKVEQNGHYLVLKPALNSEPRESLGSPEVVGSSPIGQHEGLKPVVPSKYPEVAKQQGDVTILLFYAYCSPVMTSSQQDHAIGFCYNVLTQNKVSGRLRIGREGYNSTLTGSYEGIRKFTESLRSYDPSTFLSTDFKYVDYLPENQRLKGLKVWPVKEIVTYGFNPLDAPLEKTGTHLSPEEFHKALEDPNAVVIDVRNFNETLIGKFFSPVVEVLDPCMRRSTEFPNWVEENRAKLDGKKVLMYCTGLLSHHY